MFKLLKNNLLNILDETQSERTKLKTSPLCKSIKNRKTPKSFYGKPCL